jgi:hypothetical protein
MILPLVSLKSLFKISINAIIQNIEGNNINMKTIIRCITESDKIVIGIGVKIYIKLLKKCKKAKNFKIL